MPTAAPDAGWALGKAGLKDRFPPFGDIHIFRQKVQASLMAKPTARQRYHLFQFVLLRGFGVFVGALGFLLSAASLPEAIRLRDAALLAGNIVAGLIVLAIGVAIYLGGGAIQRRYETYIESEID